MKVEAQKRTSVGKGLHSLRDGGLLPAILYGHGVQNVPIQVLLSDFMKVYRHAGESTLLDLVVDGARPVKVIIHDVQHDPTTRVPLHADFHQVKMTEKLTTEIPLTFQGESRAVKELGAVLVKHLAEIKVECLPSDLVHEIVVDVSSLETVGSSFAVRDLPVPPHITILEKPDDIVVAVMQERHEEEEVVVTPEEEQTVEAVEVTGKGKKKDEEEAEGETARGSAKE